MPNVVSVAPSIAELARGEKNRIINHSLSHSPSLFDMPGTEAYRLAHFGKQAYCVLRSKNYGDGVGMGRES